MTKDNKGYHILVIEDNNGDFVLIEDFLFEYILDPKIVLVESYKTAHAELVNGNNPFDIILLDLSLPDHTGVSLIMDILALCPNIPVIVLTGYTDFDFGLKSLAMGVSDYILKEDLTAIGLYKSIIYSSERKKNTLALEESEKKYSELFQLSPLPMWVVDINTLRFLDVNSATINHYGYSSDEFLSMTLNDIRPQSEIPQLNKLFLQNDIFHDPGFNTVMIHRKKNGEMCNVEIQVAAIRYKGKKANIVIASDITDRLDYIMAIEKQNKMFREISWIQSHVVRAPLCRIMGLTRLLKEAKDDHADLDEIMNWILVSANELDEVIKNIVDKTKVYDDKVPPQH